MINLGERQVVDALVVMVVVVVIDDGADRRLKFTLQVAVLQGNLPDLTGGSHKTHAVILSFMAEMTPPVPMAGRSLL